MTNKLKSGLIYGLTLGVTAVGAAQTSQKFPLRPGEWTSATPDPTNHGQPMVTLFCMNDETWTKALNHSRACSLQQVNIGSGGGTYSIDCTGGFQMKGQFKLTFDGMTHMVSKGSIDMTVNGKTTHTDATSDFHWKGPACNPNADVNLIDHSKPR
jgi:hypothetical protein